MARKIDVKWSKRKVVHRWNDGWTVEVLDNKRDLEIEDALLFGKQSCLTSNHWPFWVDGNGYLLYSVRDERGWPQATLLFGEAIFTLVNRFFQAHPGYTREAIYDQDPRILDGRAVIALQCCPEFMPNSDPNCTKPVTRRVKLWYEDLPRARRNNGGDVRGIQQKLLTTGKG